MGNITHTVGIVLCLSTESDPMKDPQIIRFLFRLHASAHYSGFYPMAECLYHLTETEEAASRIIRDVLKPVSRLYGISEHALYRRLETLVRVMYREAPPDIWDELMLPLKREPSVGQFLSAAALYLLYEEK